VTDILCITLSNIGDAVLTTPVLELLRRAYPQATFDLVGDARSIEVFTNLPGLRDGFLKDKSALRRGSIALLRSLRRRHYELVVDLRSPYFGYLLRGRRKVCTPWRRNPWPTHAAERHVAVLHPVLGAQPAPPVQLWLPPSGSGPAAERMGRLPAPCLAVAPGANWAGKTWPAAHFRTLLHALAPNVGSLLLLGSKAERELCEQLMVDLPLPHWNAAGETSLLETAACLRQTALLIGNDSGVGHLAAAVGIPTLTLFGPGQPERYRPWSTQAHWLVAPGQDLQQLQPAEVAQVVRGLLSRGAA
jgi:heptosyltransferase III